MKKSRRGRALTRRADTAFNLKLVEGLRREVLAEVRRRNMSQTAWFTDVLVSVGIAYSKKQQSAAEILDGLAGTP